MNNCHRYNTKTNKVVSNVCKSDGCVFNKFLLTFFAFNYFTKIKPLKFVMKKNLK